jgi:8-oxo-dGTP pyrophosphatase MutT (NUDIX family)
MQVDEDNVPILKGRSLRPKDAATVLVIRRDGPSPRVLMGRRAKGHVFMASKWVFPGGRLHPADFRVAAASELHDETATSLCRTAPPARARALAAAAVRELFEETGLVLGAPGSGRTKSPEWRDFLAICRIWNRCGSWAAPSRRRCARAGSMRVSSRWRRIILSASIPALAAASSMKSPGLIGTRRKSSTCPASRGPSSPMWRRGSMIRRGPFPITVSTMAGIGC